MAATRAGISVNNLGMPTIQNQAFSNQLSIIQNVSVDINCPTAYRYSQTANSYGFTFPKERCAAYALATAKSIINKKTITPKDLITDDGKIDSWLANDAFRLYTTAEKSYLAINAQLSMGKPALIYVKNPSNGREHWGTVVARVNGIYWLIDPWEGKRVQISDMQIFKEGGASVSGYAIVGFEY